MYTYLHPIAFGVSFNLIQSHSISFNLIQSHSLSFSIFNLSGLYSRGRDVTNKT